MIRLHNISLFQGTKQLLNDVQITIPASQKVGIVGENGCGKSSLFKMLKNELYADKGDLELPNKWRLAAAKQETPETEIRALDYVLEGHKRYAELIQLIEKANEDNDGEKIATLHNEFDEINGWSLPSQAAKLLSGLSFSEEQMNAPVKSLSGGWRMRLNLAQALIQPSDLMLLDEPTNHLDIEAVLWVQDFLHQYDGTLLVISHDKDFLDSFCTHILHFDNQKLNQYTGNYSNFIKQKHERDILQQAQFNKQQKEIEHLEKFISRFKAKASKATQAQSRVKALDKMDRISAVHTRAKFGFEFPPLEKGTYELMKLENANVGYGDTTILSDITMNIHAGQRICLLGRNGQGKSTLIKLICGELEKQAGYINRSVHFNAGYFAQHQVEQLNMDESPIWHIQSLGTNIKDQDARNFLGGFAFNGDKATDCIKGFSGGEKARLVLAMITWQKPNVLLLDEPTNHFDIEMREALSLALQSYEGAVILVAHDQNLIETVSDEFWVVNEGSVTPFDGDLRGYQKWLKEHRWSESKDSNSDKSGKDSNSDKSGPGKSNSEKSNTPNPSKVDKKEQKRLDAELRKIRSPIVNRLKKVEGELEKNQAKRAEIEDQMSDSELYNSENKAKLDELLKSSSETNEAIDNLEMEWLELNEKLEELEA